MRTIFQQIEMHAASAPEKPAILLPDRVITYKMLVEGIASIQIALATLALDCAKQRLDCAQSAGRARRRQDRAGRHGR